MKTVVDLTVYNRILEFYSRVALAHPNPFDFFDIHRQSLKVYVDLVELCGKYTLPHVPRIKQWRDAGYLELFCIKSGWCFGYTIEVIDGVPIRHIRVCEKSENIR